MPIGPTFVVVDRVVAASRLREGGEVELVQHVTYHTRRQARQDLFPYTE